MTRPRARMVTDLTWESCETYKALREAPATRVPGIGKRPAPQLTVAAAPASTRAVGTAAVHR